MGNTWVCKDLSWVTHLVMFMRVVCSHGLVEIGEIFDLVGQGSRPDPGPGRFRFRAGTGGSAVQVHVNRT